MVTGDHACLPFDSHDDRWAIRAAFTTEGLARGERVMLFTDPGTSPAAALSALSGHGVPAERAAATGQLEVVDETPGYDPARGFAPEDRVALWSAIRADAHDRGYAGLRAVGDMAWAARPDVSPVELARYEAGLTRLFRRIGFTAICEYDRRVFPAAVLADVTAAHPLSVLTPLDSLHISRDGPVLTLVGSADLATRREFDRAVRTALTPSPPLTTLHTVDLTGLTFLDAHCAATLLRHPAPSPRHPPLTVLCTPAQLRMLQVCGASEADGLSLWVR
jgi:hypothetical protein